MLDELWDIFNQDARPVACAVGNDCITSAVESQDRDKLKEEVVPLETGCDVVNSEIKKKKSKRRIEQSGSEVKEEVDCDGPIKKKKKTDTQAIVEEQVNVVNGRKKKRKKREVATDSVVEEQKPVDEEKVLGLENVDEVVGSDRKRKPRSEEVKKRRLEVSIDTAVVSSCKHRRKKSKMKLV